MLDLWLPLIKVKYGVTVIMYMVKEKMNDKIRAEKSIVIASHPRSGTHLLIDFIRKNIPEASALKKRFTFKSETYIDLDDILGLEESIHEGRYRAGLTIDRPIYKTHRLPDYEEPFQYITSIVESQKALANLLQREAKHIYVYRDLTKVMISLYQYSGEWNQGVGFSEFIREVRGARNLSRVGFWALHMTKWCGRENTLLINFADIIAEPLKAYAAITGFCDLPSEHRAVQLPVAPKTLFEQRIKRFFSSKPESSGIFSFSNRMPTVTLSNEDLDFMKQEVNEVNKSLFKFNIGVC